ncbi:MAG: cobalamin-binding protein [Candidatus Lokiarchaeota archaeon]|nr:cobalamin-binding protein [Candidatus Lokiarchaeota archaeon]
MKLSLKEISEALIKLEEEKVLQLVKEKIDANEDPIKILEACRKGMAEIGKGNDDEIFLTDLIMVGEIFNETLELLMPKLMSSTSKSLGKIIIGTVEGDIHNIGKDIAIKFLKAEGFEVIDLGVNVSSQKFVDAIKEHNPLVVGMSGLLTLSIKPMKKSVEAIIAANLRDKIKIIIGGERTDEEVCKYVGADAWVNEVIEGIKIIKKWTENA